MLCSPRFLRRGSSGLRPQRRECAALRSIERLGAGTHDCDIRIAVQFGGRWARIGGNWRIIALRRRGSRLERFWDRRSSRSEHCSQAGLRIDAGPSPRERTSKRLCRCAKQESGSHKRASIAATIRWTTAHCHGTPQMRLAAHTARRKKLPCGPMNVIRAPVRASLASQPLIRPPGTLRMRKQLRWPRPSNSRSRSGARSSPAP